MRQEDQVAASSKEDEEPEPKYVVSRCDELGCVVTTVEVASGEAAIHWDDKLWVKR